MQNKNRGCISKLTLKDLFAATGKRHLTQVSVRTPSEVASCEDAGIDMLVTAELNDGQSSDYVGIRKAAPHTFLTIGLDINTYAGHTEVLRNAY